MPSRDLKVTIDGDAKGFDAACQSAEDKARALDRELARMAAQQAAVEAVTAKTAAIVKDLGSNMDRTGLAARKMGLDLQASADRAAKATLRATAAAEAHEKGLTSEAKAAQLAAAADKEVERHALKVAEAELVAAEAAKKKADAERKAAEEAAKADVVNKQVQGTLASLITAGVALSPTLIAAGGAALAFGAVAAPSILKVVKAQENLAANWDTLDRGQKIAAVGVANLVDQYKALAKSYEPDALRVFNGLLGTARAQLPQLDKTVSATRQGFTDFASTVTGSLDRELPRLFGIIQADGTPALHELGTTFTQTAGLAVNLLQGLAPMGMTLLHTANGALTLLNALTSLDPHIAEFAATAYALRAPTQALSKLWSENAGKLGIFGKSASTAESEASGLAKTATKTESAFGKLGKVVGSSPNLYIGAALAVAYLAARLSAAGNNTDHLVAALRTQYNAFGNNVAGYRAVAAALTPYIEKERTAAQVIEQGAGDIRDRQHATVAYSAELKNLTDARNAQLQAARNVEAGERQLSQTYGVTATQAGQLATAAGVDLSKALDKSGNITQQNIAKIAQYQAAVAQAANPTERVAQDMTQVSNSGLLMKDRLSALSDALDAYYNKASQAWDATTAVKKGMDALSKALKAAKGDYSGNTQASQDLRDAFHSELDAVNNLHTSLLQTQGYDVAQKATADQVQVMLALAGGSKEAQGLVAALANSLQVAGQKSGLSHDQFIAAAKALNLSASAAEAAWKAYQKLKEPVKLTADDKEFLAKLKAVKGLKIDPKTGRLLGNNADFLNKWLTVHHLKINPKTGRIEGDNNSYLAAWLRVHNLRIDPKTGKIVGDTSAFWDAVHNIPATVGFRKIGVYYVPLNSANEPGKTHADGAIVRYANGGVRRDLDPFIAASPTVLFGETSTGGEAFIPLGQNKRQRSVGLLSDVAHMFGMSVQPMAAGGTLSASSTPTTPLSLSDVLQHWDDTVSPATSKQVTAALKARRNETNKLKSAEDALYKAEHARHRDARTIAADERRVAADRQDLAAATSKLNDVENRYRYAKYSPATQLSVALSLGIKDNAAFIKNLQTLADRGFGDLAQKLLAMGGPKAEKIAADAAKFSTSKLKSIQSKITQEQNQENYLANLPAILSIRSAIKNTKGGISSWVALLNATGLDGGTLSDAVKLMASDLSKTASGKALIADMHAHGYAHGGIITGPPGTDRVPLWGTAGEMVINRQSTAANRALLDAINYSPVRLPVTPLPIRGGDGAAAGPQVTQVFRTQDMDVHQLARESARELAWTLRG